LPHVATKKSVEFWKTGSVDRAFCRRHDGARAAADLVGGHRNTAIVFYHRLRLMIAEELTKASPLSEEVEVDDSYFGGRPKGKRGRGAAGKVPVFGILKRGGRSMPLPFPMRRQPPCCLLSTK